MSEFLPFQEKYFIREKYLDGSELSGRMRAILIDWLVQVHLRFHLLQETLYLTVAIIDRFLQVSPSNPPLPTPTISYQSRLTGWCRFTSDSICSKKPSTSQWPD